MAVAGKVARHVAPSRGIPLAEAHTTRSRRIRPEVIERMLERGHSRVVGREAEVGRVWQPVILNGPAREALAVEALVVLVLVEVEQGVDAVCGERARRRSDAREVRIVVHARRRLHRPVDNPEPHDIEPIARQERRIVIAEPSSARQIRRPLIDHVQPMKNQDAPRRISDPPPSMPRR